MAIRPSAAFSEKRRLLRLRRPRRAHCVFDDGAVALDVTLRNISPFGAKIAGRQLTTLPATFELRIDDELGGYSARSARLIWTRGAVAGVEFTD